MRTWIFLVFFLLSQQSARADILNEAHDAFKEGRYDEASRKFLGAEVDNPDRLDYTYNRAVSQFFLKDFKAAKQGFEKAANSKNQDLALMSLYNLGNTQVALGELEEAVKTYEKVLKTKPDDKESRENLKWVQEQIEKKKKEEEEDKKKECEKCNNKKKDKDGKEDKNKKENDKDKDKEQKKDKGEQKKDEQAQEKQGQKDEKKQPEEQQKSEEQQQAAAGGQQKQDNATGQQQTEAVPLSKEEAEKILRGVEEKVPVYKFGKEDAAPRQESDKDW